MVARNYRAALMAALFCFSWALPQAPSPVLRQKLEQAVGTAFELESFRLEALSVPEASKAKGGADFSEYRLYRITSGEQPVGFAYLGEAPSMKNVFDYVVLFDPDLSIRKSKVLIYREDYGRQIGSQRWLQQFIGLKAGQSVVYGETVDAISGATISAKSMSTAVDRLLEGMASLREKGIL